MFKVLQIDHVELFVPDRYEAAKWYARVVTKDAVVDHQQAYSIYFDDPYGHQLEVTTCEYDDTAAWLTSP